MKKIIFMIFPILLFASINVVQRDFNIKKSIKSWIEFKNDNLVRQKYDYSCGSASLATILKYFYDQNISERIILGDILKVKGIDKEGQSLSFLELSQYLKNKNFKAIGLALDLKALRNLKMPVILFVKIRRDEHFTVFRGIDNKYVYLADPSLGNSKIRINKFREMFYQRDDLQHPGKVLAILPVDKNITLNKKFMKIEKSSTFIYEMIDSNAILN